MEAKIVKENIIKEENERIKQWEINFDAEQEKKEKELIKKFSVNNLKEEENDSSSKDQEEKSIN